MEEGHIAAPPSRKTLLRIVGGGIVVAAALLTCVILPAEYGIDPLATGKALGLSGLAKKAATPASPVTITTGATIAPVLLPGKQTSRWGESAQVRGAFIAQPQQFSIDARDVTLDPGQGMEIKYHLAKGAGLIYSWTATGRVLYDFHGEPDSKPAGETSEEYFESYERDDAVGKTDAHGTLIAPSTGIHGWYWENAGEQPIMIKLVTSGFYDWVFQNRDEQKVKLKATDVNSIPRHPGVPDLSLQPKADQ